MTKKEKYKNKDFIMKCDMPSELFTVKGIKSEYRTLAKLWHPDVADAKEALFIMSKINALYHEGQSLIEKNAFYEKERLLAARHSHVPKKDDKPFQKQDERETKRSKKKRTIELVTVEGKCVKFRYLKRVMIELGFMYVSEEHVLLEVTKLKRKIYMDALSCVKADKHSYFNIELPQLVDSFDTKTHGYIVLKKARGIEPIMTLEMVSGYVKALGCRKICEGIFYDLTALKYLGLTSTGLEKDLMFIDVSSGKLHNVGLFFYLHEFSAQLNRAPKGITESMKSIRRKSNESMIIDLVKHMIVRLNISSGLIMDDFYRWISNLNSDSLEASLAESQVFNRAIASVTTHGFNLDQYYISLSHMEG